MFRQSKILWPLLFHVSILLILKKYGITEGVLVGDDSDHPRAKVTKRIFAAHKIFDKKTGGWFNGQTVVLLYLVTAKVSLAVGFAFYQPDPALTAWKTADEALKKQGVKKPRGRRSRRRTQPIRANWISSSSCYRRLRFTIRPFG